MLGYYPPTNFHFSVVFEGLSPRPHDIRFQSVSGLNVQFDTEPIKEGGVNQYEHVLPTRRKYADLVLKRGLVTSPLSAVSKWCTDAFDKFEMNPVDLHVFLLNELHIPVVAWKVIHAWPKKWQIADFNAEKGEVLIETLELNYNRFELKSIPGIV